MSLRINTASAIIPISLSKDRLAQLSAELDGKLSPERLMEILEEVRDALSNDSYKKPIIQDLIDDLNNNIPQEQIQHTFHGYVNQFLKSGGKRKMSRRSRSKRKLRRRTRNRRRL